VSESAKRVLNVGGSSKAIAIPDAYAGWEHVLLDIDPKSGADVICDARDLYGLPGESFDAVYCSHNLEHYYAHDAIDVLLGFAHVLRSEGFAHIRVPDIGEVMRVVAQREMDIDDVLYQSAAGPINVRDIVYGYQSQIESSGEDFFAHKNGFTQPSLKALLTDCGFRHLFLGSGEFEIIAYAFKHEPDAFHRQLLRLDRWGNQ
jgi:SAM-dependent methyltransferase